MIKSDFTLEFIRAPSRLAALCAALLETPAFALDIETVEWWNRRRERVALIQIAFRRQGKTKVAVIDALAGFDLEPLRAPLALASAVKVIHNAGFDAARLAAHYDFNVSPVFDTMLAARRSGERKYSLKAQALIYLNLALDKFARQSDWSRRPLDHRQLSYAALDAFAALLLYENQNLNGEYRRKSAMDSSQGFLPLDEALSVAIPPPPASAKETGQSLPMDKLSAVAAALLGIVTELPSRYNPEQLSVSLGQESRVGLAGWIVDNRLGRDAELDEETVRMTIAGLCEQNLLRITGTRRLEATAEGARLWQKVKSN
jgi:hypothetical protein